MEKEIIREQCCCFTGHRANTLHRSEEEIKEDLRREINSAFESGYTTFITGMAFGVDIWAGELVLELRKQHCQVRLVSAIPYRGFEERWDAEWQSSYRKLLKKADEVHYICDGYASFAYQRRNEWMVDRSSRVIAVFYGEAGGTRNTINYAQKKSVPVVLIEG